MAATITTPTITSAATLAALALAACAPSRMEAFEPVSAAVASRTGHALEWRSPMMSDERIRAAVDELLAGELEQGEAIRIALLNNRRLQAAFDELGIARGELATATVLENPELEAELRWVAGGDDPELELSALQDVSSLLSLGRRRGAAAAELEAARAEAIGAAIDLVAAVSAAYYTAQADAQRVELRRTIALATDAALTLARSLHQAGNLTDLDLLRQQDLHEEARIALADAEAARLRSREHLNAVLGLWGEDTAWTLPARLEDLPAEELELEGYESEAVARSVDLESERWRGRAAAERLGLRRIERWLPGLGLGVSAERGGDGDWGLGPAIAISIPIWNRGGGAVDRERAAVSRSENRHAALAIELRAGARAARDRLRAARARVETYRDRVLPLRERLVAETLRAYNAMAASTFELLEARRRQIEAGADYVDALLEYWLARAAAEQILAGRPADTTASTTGAGAAESGAARENGSP